MKSTKIARFLNQFYSGKACASAVKIGGFVEAIIAGMNGGMGGRLQHGQACPVAVLGQGVR